MLGFGLFLGWFGFGVRRDLFTVWIDAGPLTVGVTPLVARARVHEVAKRARKIKASLPALTRRVGK